ncbi:MAG: hypothetical protein MI744_14645 [Pseudomonadales bacterium]|nr:hypothetical protein [Pseudomonadales bacterium]
MEGQDNPYVVKDGGICWHKHHINTTDLGYAELGNSEEPSCRECQGCCKIGDCWFHEDSTIGEVTFENSKYDSMLDKILSTNNDWEKTESECAEWIGSGKCLIQLPFGPDPDQREYDCKIIVRGAPNWYITAIPYFLDKGKKYEGLPIAMSWKAGEEHSEETGEAYYIKSESLGTCDGGYYKQVVKLIIDGEIEEGPPIENTNATVTIINNERCGGEPEGDAP